MRYHIFSFIILAFLGYKDCHASILKNKLEGKWIVTDVDDSGGEVSLYGNYQSSDFGLFSVYDFVDAKNCKIKSGFSGSNLSCKWRIKKGEVLFDLNRPTKLRRSYALEILNQNNLKLTKTSGRRGEVLLLKRLSSLSADTGIFEHVVKSAMFKYGKDSLVKYIYNSLDQEIRKSLAIESIMVKLVVEKEGIVSSIEIMDNASQRGSSKFSKDVLDLFVKIKNEWNPGSLENINVRSIQFIDLKMNSVTLIGTRSGHYNLVVPKEYFFKPDSWKEDITVYTDVDVEGTYPGGEAALTSFIQKSFQMPTEAMEEGISGMVFIQFVVEKDGTITNIRPIAPKFRQLGYGLEKECMRVIMLTSGKWSPALRKNKPVRSYWRFPFIVDNSGF